jgi:hypothetical protein
MTWRLVFHDVSSVCSFFQCWVVKVRCIVDETWTTWCQCYTAFVVDAFARVFVGDKHFQPSLTFSAETGAHPSARTSI